MEAKTRTEIGGEKEAIEFVVVPFKDKTQEEITIGKKLYDNNSVNASIWDIIIVIEDGEKKSYGTNWRYIPSGTVIENYGEAKYNWVANVETGEVVLLEEDSYKEYDHNMSLAVGDDLVFTMDASNITSDKSTWGNNVNFYYFDDEEFDTRAKRLSEFEKEKGYNVTNFEGYDRQKSENVNDYWDSDKNFFKFSGNNYIEIYNPNGFDFSNGFTFEFYGIINNGLGATLTQSPPPMLAIWDGRYSAMSPFRCRYSSLKNISYCLTYASLGSKSSKYGSFESSGTPWNQIIHFENFLNNELYFTLVFNPNDNEKVSQTAYIDGEKIANGELTKEYYNSFVNTSKNLKYIEFGRVQDSAESNWVYMVGSCYACRIYNKALSAQDVLDNYQTTSTYRSLEK